MKDRIRIIAEAGVNHNGSIERAKEMISAAAEAGADIVKFQTFKTEKLVNTKAPQADYQKQNMGVEVSQYEMLKSLEISYKEHYDLKEYADKCGIEFNSTPFDEESIRFLDELGISFWKIPSGEITNIPYLRKIAGFPRKIIMSTGMSRIGEVELALNTLIDAGINRDDVIVLHCTTDYPTRFHDVNLLAMCSLSSALGVKTGYSDHTPGIEVPIAAAALGAIIIEKHFTLDKELPGPDHKASLNFSELAAMVKSIRNIEVAMGDGLKQPSSSEMKNIKIARKSIVAAKNIACGEILSQDNLGVKRPGDGISPVFWDSLIGTAAMKNYKKDDKI